MRNMLVCLALLSVTILTYADSASTEDAEAAAIAWLALVDSVEYEKSWLEASPLLRHHVGRDAWASQLNNLRTPLGKLESRKLGSAEYQESLPGVPDGQYVLFVFDSSFEGAGVEAEIVVVAMGEDSVWRVIGYYFG